MSSSLQPPRSPQRQQQQIRPSSSGSHRSAASLSSAHLQLPSASPPRRSSSTSPRSSPILRLTPEPFRRDRANSKQQPHSPNSAALSLDDPASDSGGYDPIREDKELEDPLDKSGELEDSEELRQIVATAASITGLDTKQPTVEKQPASASITASLDASVSSSQPGGVGSPSSSADTAALQRQIASERIVLSDLMNKLNTLQSHSNSLQSMSDSSRRKQQQMAQMMAEGQKKTDELEEQRKALQKQLDEITKFGEQQRELERRNSSQSSRRRESEVKVSNKNSAASAQTSVQQQQPQQQQRGRARTTTKAPPQQRNSYVARNPSTSSVDASASPILRGKTADSDNDEIDSDAAQLAQLEDLMAHLASTADVQRRSVRASANGNGIVHEEEEGDEDEDEEKEIDERLFYGRHAMEQAKQEQQRLRNIRSNQPQQLTQQQEQHHQRHRTGIQAQNVSRKIGAIEAVLHPSETSVAEMTARAARTAAAEESAEEGHRERARYRQQRPADSPTSDFSVSPSPSARAATAQQRSQQQQQQQQQRPQSAQASPTISAVPASRVPPVPISRWIGPTAMPSAGGSGRHAVYADRPATAVGTTRGAVSGRGTATTQTNANTATWQVPTFSTLSNRTVAATPSLSSKSSMLAHAESSGSQTSTSTPTTMSEGSYTQRRGEKYQMRRDGIAEDGEEEEGEEIDEEEEEDDAEEDEEEEEEEEYDEEDDADEESQPYSYGMNGRSSAPNPYLGGTYLDSDSELAYAINSGRNAGNFDNVAASGASARPKTARALNPAENLNGQQRTSARPETAMPNYYAQQQQQQYESQHQQRSESPSESAHITSAELHAVLAHIGAALYRHTISLTNPPQRMTNSSRHSYKSASTFGGPALGAGRLGAQRYTRPESAPQIAKERVNKTMRARAWQ